MKVGDYVKIDFSDINTDYNIITKVSEIYKILNIDNDPFGVLLEKPDGNQTSIALHFLYEDGETKAKSRLKKLKRIMENDGE